MNIFWVGHLTLYIHARTRFCVKKTAFMVWDLWYLPINESKYQFSFFELSQFSRNWDADWLLIYFITIKIVIFTYRCYFTKLHLRLEYIYRVLTSIRLRRKTWTLYPWMKIQHVIFLWDSENNQFHLIFLKKYCLFKLSHFTLCRYNILRFEEIRSEYILSYICS